MDDFEHSFGQAGGLGLLDASDPSGLHSLLGPPPPCPLVLQNCDSMPLFSGATAQMAFGGLPALGPAPWETPPTEEAAPSRGTAAGGSSSDRAAIAREKNRIAQRRFREKEKQRLAEVQTRADSLEAQMAALRLENAELAHMQRLMEKTLTVRNAMLALASKLEPDAGGASSAAAPLPDALHDPSVQAASRQLAEAVGELPSMEQVEAMVAQLTGSSSEDSTPSSTTAAHEASWPGAAPLHDAGPAREGSSGWGAPSPAASARLSDVVAAGVAGDAGDAAQRLREVGVPPPDKACVRQNVQGMERVDDMMAQYLEWRRQLQAAYSAAQAHAFQGQCMVELEATVRVMQELWWYAAQLRPDLFKGFVQACLPPSGDDMSGWLGPVAEHSMDLLSEEEILILRQAWQRYMRRAAVAAVAARPWVQRLQALVAKPGTEAMHTVAQQHLRVGEVASRLHQACQEQYTAAMAFLLEMSTRINLRVRCYWHLATEGHMPDHPALISEILRLHQQRRLAAQPDRPLGAGSALGVLAPPPHVGRSNA